MLLQDHDHQRLTSGVRIEDVLEARVRIREGVSVTPCLESASLSALCGCRVFAKLEYLHNTGSFKERGACNALMQLSAEQRRCGVVAASAGNHALGLAWHGRKLGIPVTVVMPVYAPLVKSNKCTALGARVIRRGETFAEARQYADKLVETEKLIYVHGFDDPAVIAGQGTVGLEILEQVPDVSAIIVPVGGAGLLAGVALAVKSTKPSVSIIAVQSAATPTYTGALAAGRAVAVDCLPTLADGLATGQVGALAFEIARDRVDRVVTVEEADIALSVLRLMEMEKSVVEGSGAASLAALLSGQLPELKDQTVVLLLCGGNIDPLIFSRVIEKGLAADGRLCKLRAVISDRPGGLAKFASAVAATGAGIVEVQHDRAFSGADVSSTNVLCTLETRDQAHIGEVLAALSSFRPMLVETPAKFIHSP